MKLIIGYDNFSDEASEWLEFRPDNWDDFGYKTTAYVEYVNINNVKFKLGDVQIGYAGMTEGRVFTTLDHCINMLPSNYFSLGTAEDYYANIRSLDPLLAEKIFKALNDMAYNLDIFTAYQNEEVVKISLLRGRSAFSVEQQLHRIAHGGAILTPYNFNYILDQNSNYTPLDLEFNIMPDSNPPTNIHVLIGRNGTGKTHLIRNMVKALLFEEEKFGTYSDQDDAFNDVQSFFCFANVLCVSFSPFDDYSTLSENENSKLPFSHIGLNKDEPNLLSNISKQFINSFSNCMGNNDKIKRWENTIELLKSDPAFEESKVYFFVNKWRSDERSYKQVAKKFLEQNFKNLSSGHKVILLIITACVDKLEEKSIIFLDEPENHLHPPLLSAFIRALSYLLIDRNSIAIIATHSPVVLQEVPKSCIWKLNRSGNIIQPSRLEMETFGATIGSLTREIFGLEVRNSGFNKLLSEEVEKGYSFNQIMRKYNMELGEEARTLLQTLLILKENKDEKN